MFFGSTLLLPSAFLYKQPLRDFEQLNSRLIEMSEGNENEYLQEPSEADIDYWANPQDQNQGSVITQTQSDSVGGDSMGDRNEHLQEPEGADSGAAGESLQDQELLSKQESSVIVADAAAQVSRQQPPQERSQALQDLAAIERAQNWEEIEKIVRCSDERFAAAAKALYPKYSAQGADTKSREVFTLPLMRHLYESPQSFEKLNWIPDKLNVRALEELLEHYESAEFIFTLQSLNSTVHHTASVSELLIQKRARLASINKVGNLPAQYIWQELDTDKKAYFSAGLQQIIKLELSQ